jgi:NTE family protein
LSGSGFRAALFHLGALRRLDELQLLGKLWTIASTSGGSIAAAHIATRVPWPLAERTADWEDRVAAPLRAFARSNLRARQILSRLLATLVRSDFPADPLARAFERRLTPLSLRDLPALPNFLFAGADPVAPSVAHAVAATAEGFSPDHLAVEPVWRDHQVILVSDGGGLFDREAAIEREARALGKRWLIGSFRTGVLTGTYWGIESARARYGLADRMGYSKDFAKAVLSQIPGDLSGLSEARAAVLENHGYLVADAAIAAHLPELLPHPTPPLAVPHPGRMEPPPGQI